MCLRLELGNFPIAPSVYMLYLKDYTSTCCYAALCVCQLCCQHKVPYTNLEVYFFSLNKFCPENGVIFFCPRL